MGGMTGKKHSEETRKKMSVAALGKPKPWLRNRPPESNPRWKGGGLWKDGTGYLVTRIYPGHKFYEMAPKNGVVMEHRLVVAEELGRPLTSLETVHHKNGIKTDNRIENLELRNGNHGTGVILHCQDCGSRNVLPA